MPARDLVEAEIAKVMPTRGLGDVELELLMQRVLRAYASVDRAVAKSSLGTGRPTTPHSVRECRAGKLPAPKPVLASGSF